MSKGKKSRAGLCPPKLKDTFSSNATNKPSKHSNCWPPQFLVRGQHHLSIPPLPTDGKLPNPLSIENLNVDFCKARRPQQNNTQSKPQ
jgi:hypothetical protein